MLNFAGLSEEQRQFFIEFFGNKRLIAFPQGNMLKERIDLTTAQTAKRFDYAGDFVYSDRNSTGVINVGFNSLAMPAFPFGSNTAVNGFPYKEIYLSWDAQPGLFANVWYGYGANIIPPNQDISQILSTVNVSELGTPYATAFSSATILAANTVQNVIAAGINVNGYRLVSANSVHRNATASGGAYLSMLAKATAPASTVDGDVLAMAENSYTLGVVSWGNLYLKRPMLVTSGKRLDWIASVAEDSSQRGCNYSLL